MLTVLLGVKDICLMKILLEWQRATSNGFKNDMLDALYRRLHGGGRLRRLIHWRLHFDNAFVHNPKGVSEKVTEYGVFSFADPPYSPNTYMSPCGLFLFRYLREQLKHINYSASDRREGVIICAVDVIPRTLLSNILQNWRRRLEA
jgi:hypothetical protein